MKDSFKFDYFYGSQAEQFSFLSATENSDTR